MTLRTTAIISGVLGLLMLIAGLVSDALRADREVVATANLDTAIAVVGPEVLALPGIERIVITGEGALEAHTARPGDAATWLLDKDATAVTGFSTWEELSLADAASATADLLPSTDATAQASASASATPSPSPSPSPSPEASPSPSPSASAEEPEAIDYGSGDVFRHDWRGHGRLAVTGTQVAPGEALILLSASGDPLGTIEFVASRNVNDGWIAPLIWIGAALALMGAAAALSAVVDTRPAQARAEAWLRARRGETGFDPKPGSRRERRLAGPTVPRVELAEDPDPVAEFKAAQAAKDERASKDEQESAPVQESVDNHESAPVQEPEQAQELKRGRKPKDASVEHVEHVESTTTEDEGGAK